MISQSFRFALRKLGSGSRATATRIPPDFGDYHINIIRQVKPFTMTSYERLYALIEAVRYILKNNIKGAFLECGVYKGGSMMAIALTLLAEGVTDRKLYLFDSFAGMPKPDKTDIDLWGRSATRTFVTKRISDSSSTWANASLECVKKVMQRTAYPKDNIHFVEGLVEETIPGMAPATLSLARLDTDWYQSTAHELTHLYPRLSPKGILIVDDYGHFKGARQAVDEFFSHQSQTPLFHRIDYTARLMIKD